MAGWMLLSLVVPWLVPVDDSTEPKTVTVRGEVMTLGEALGSFGVSGTQGPIEDQVVLRTEGGAIEPLLYNVGSRAFFEDDRLRNRSAELVARRLEGLPYLQVVSARIQDEDGEWRIPEYYCDICTISVRFDQPCPCCQAPMELRSKPER